MQKRKFFVLIPFFIIMSIVANAQFDKGTFVIKNVATGRFLDVFEYKTDNESPVKLWDYTGADNQKWYFEMTPSGSYVISGVQSSKCLDANATMLKDNGTPVQIYDCHKGANQQWQLVPTAKNGVYIIHNVQSNRCLDADAPTSGNNGTKVQLWDCHNGPNQQWEIRRS